MKWTRNPNRLILRNVQKKIQRTVTYHNVDRVKKDAYNVNQGPNRLLRLDKSLRLIFVGDRVNRHILLVRKKKKDNSDNDDDDHLDRD
jgi:hypothetical protein